MPKSFDVIFAAFPHNIELPEPVHDIQAFSRQCEHPLTAVVFFDDNIFLNQPVQDNHRIRFNSQ
jgi:hypothetical protein